MVDTVRTLAALQALLADNTAGDISAQDVRDFLVSVFPPQFSGASVTKSADQSLTGDVLEQITFDTTNYDTDSYLSSNTLVAPTTAKYLVWGNIHLEKDTSDRIIAAGFRINDTSSNLTDTAFGSISTAHQFCCLSGSQVVELDADDAVSAWGQVVEGSTQEIRARTMFGMYRVAQNPA